MTVNAHPLGTLIETEKMQILFGNKLASIAAVSEAFPDIKMKRIKQVHGDTVIHTSPHAIDFSREADAHYTGESKLGLCIATADCIPVVLFHHNPTWIACIHAGWRGVQKKIIPKTLAQFERLKCSIQDIHVFVGPHIQKQSFEVGNDVRDLLLASCPEKIDSVIESINDEKSRVDLNSILKSQLFHAGVDPHNCYFEVKDTVTNSDYHSFRRDREDSGRQISFVALS
jgi:YfiH family protein